MKVSLGVQPYLFPMPVLIIGTYCENDIPDAMNAAWGTICDYKKIALYLSPTHKTVENIKNKKAFTVGIADVEHLIQCDYVGLVTANTDLEKIIKSGFKIIKSNNVDAPIIDDLPLTLECKLDYIDENTGCIYGDIINIIAEEKILENGKVDLNKLNPLSYDPSSRSYYTIGEKVGKAFSDGNKIKRG